LDFLGFRGQRGDFLLFMTYSFVLDNVHNNQLKKAQKSTNVDVKNMILCILAAILDFWPPSYI